MAPVRGIIAFWSGILILTVCAVISAPMYEPEEHAREDAAAGEEAAGNAGPEQPIVIPVDSSPNDAARIEPSANGRAETDSDNKDATEEPVNWILQTTGDGWAQWAMVFFALVATVISGVAVVLLKRTLKANRDLLEKTEDAISVARQTNNITRDIGEAQVRAYPSITGFDCWLHRGGSMVGFKVKGKNFGQSPMRNATLSFEAHIGTQRKVRTDILSDIPAGRGFKTSATYGDFRVPENFLMYDRAGFIPSINVRVTVVGRDVFDNTVGTLIDVNISPPSTFDQEANEIPLEVITLAKKFFVTSKSVREKNDGTTQVQPSE